MVRRCSYPALAGLLAFFVFFGAEFPRTQPLTPDPRGPQAGLTTDQAIAEGERLRRDQEQGRILTAGRDPGMVALSDCNHYVRNASGAPSLVDQMARECEAREPDVEKSHPQLKGEVQKCWGPLEAAITFLREANTKYAEARATVDPMRGQLVKEGNAKQQQAKDEIKKCDACSEKLVKLAADLGATILKEVMAQLDQLRRGQLPRPTNPGATFTPAIPGGVATTPAPPGRGAAGGATTGGNPPGRTGGSPTALGDLAGACVDASDAARNQLQALAERIKVQLNTLKPGLGDSPETTGEFFSELGVMAMEGLKGAFSVGEGLLDRGGYYLQKPGEVTRDLDKGVLNAKSAINDYIEHPQRLDKFDPLPRMVHELEAWKRQWHQSHGRAAARSLDYLPLPGCGKARTAQKIAEEARIVSRAGKLTNTLEAWLSVGQDAIRAKFTRTPRALTNAEVVAKLREARALSERISFTEKFDASDAKVARNLAGLRIQFSPPDAGRGLGVQELGARIGDGAFGDVYRLPSRPDLVAKIIHNLSDEGVGTLRRQEYGDKLLREIGIPTPRIYGIRHGGQSGVSYLIMQNLKEDVDRWKALLEASPSGSMREIPGVEDAVRDLAKLLSEKGLVWGDMKGANMYFVGSGSSMRAGILDTDLVMKIEDIDSADALKGAVRSGIASQAVGTDYHRTFMTAYGKKDAREMNRIFFRKMFQMDPDADVGF